MRYQLKINAADYTVDVEEVKAGVVRVTVNGHSYDVGVETPAAFSPTSAAPVSADAAPAAPAPPARVSAAGSGDVVAPIPGLILEIKVDRGAAVSAGQVVAVMEAMKMENNLTAPVSGVVREIRLQKGAQVSTGDVIMTIG